MNSRLLRILVLTGFLLGFSLLLSQDAGAASFTAQGLGSTSLAPSGTSQITIMINNTDASANITGANITLPQGFVFIAGSNATTASGVVFSNTSSVLSWLNATNNGIINVSGSPQNFTFNVSIPHMTPGEYNFTVNVTDTAGVSNATNVSYAIGSVLYSLTFSNNTAMQNSSNITQNLSYSISIKNEGNTSQEQYNLSVVNCSNTSQGGVGILNNTFITMSQGQNITVGLNVSSSTAGVFSSCVMAIHWNGSGPESSINITSSEDGIILISTFNTNLTASNIYWTSTVGQNPFAGGNITVFNATISNTGSINFSGNFTVYLMWDGAFSSQNVSSTSIPAGSSYNVSFSNITGITNGLHNLTVWLDPVNSVPETNDTDNNLTTQVFVGYNITVLSVVRQNGTNNAPNTNITINVSVKYANGSGAPNLAKENFTIFDIYNGSTVAAITSGSILGFVSTMNSSGVYWFNITSYLPANNTDTTPGTHNITLQVVNNESGNLYSGNSSGSDYYYLIVPKLVVTLTATSGSVSEGLTKSIAINISNTGTDSIYNITLSAIGDSYLSAGSIGGCTQPISSLNNGSYYTSCSFTATASSVSDNTDGTVSVTASGVHNYSGSPVLQYTKTGSLTLTILNVAGTIPPTDDGGGGATAKSCTTDAQCGANESCSSAKKCATISCPNGEIMDHVCINFTYKINITSYDSIVTAISGGSNSTKVTVKNTGTQTYTAKLEVSINNVTATVNPSSYSLGAGESYQFTVNFTVPNTTTIGSFSGTFKAYVSTSTSSYNAKSFTFTVIPKEETKSEINVSYQELSSVLSALIANLSQMKASGKYNQTVLSSIESLISAANSTLLEMKNAMNSDDYVSAQYLISQVNTSINGAKAQMEGAQIEVASLPAQYGIWFWVAVAVILIFVAGFFIYMFYPSSGAGYRTDKGFAPVGAKEGFGAKIKKLFRRKKKELPSPSISSIAQSVTEPPKDEEGHYDSFHYSEGYKKEKSYDYQYSDGGVKGFFQKLRRKKSKKTPQMHIDQFANPPVAEQKNE